MSKISETFIERVAHSRALRRWRRVADEAAAMDLSNLRQMRSKAKQLRRHLERMLHVADGRLTLPMVGADAIPTPLGADWSWRPELWSGPITPPGLAAVPSKTMLGAEATLFHDCSQSELTLRQVRNSRAEDLAPFGVRMDVFRFDGSFLSLVIDLPGQALVDVRKKHVIRMDAHIELEKPLEIFARLNIKHGPNTDQVVRELPLGEADSLVEFDLAYTNLNEKRVERAWVDLIFEGPQMNQVFVRDLTFTRRPRAEI